MTFPENEQKQHRAVFIQESRAKAWGAACNADYIGKSLDELVAQHQKLTEEDEQLAADFKASELALDFHTVENREKREKMRWRRNQIKQIKEVLSRNMAEGRRIKHDNLAIAEDNLRLAKHAETWGWKEPEVKTDVSQQEADSQAVS